LVFLIFIIQNKENDPEFIEWLDNLNKIYKYMKTMELNKYLEPKFSKFIKRIFKGRENAKKATKDTEKQNIGTENIVLFSKPVTILANTSIFTNLNESLPNPREKQVNHQVKPIFAKRARKASFLSKMPAKKGCENTVESGNYKKMTPALIKQLAKKVNSTGNRSKSHLRSKRQNSSIVVPKPGNSTTHTNYHSHKLSVSNMPSKQNMNSPGKIENSQITLEDYFDYLDQVSHKKGRENTGKIGCSARGSLMRSLCEDQRKTGL